MKNSKIAVAALMALAMFSYTKAEEIKVDFDGRSNFTQNKIPNITENIEAEIDYNTDIPDISGPTAARVPFVKELLAKLSPDERSVFIKTLEVKYGIILKFDESILTKYYSGEIPNEIREAFTPSIKSLNEDTDKNIPSIKLGDALRNIPQNAANMFMDNLQIHKGVIRGGRMGKLESFSERNDIEKNLFGINTGNSKTLCTANGCLGYQCWLYMTTNEFKCQETTNPRDICGGKCEETAP